MRQAPIQVINAQGRAGGGQADLQQATVQSTAFKADARGNIALAQVLTNSTINIPVAIFVSQPIGKQLNLASDNATANATYVPLPQFLTMTGTLGNPKTEINKVALAGLTLKSAWPGSYSYPTQAHQNGRRITIDFSSFRLNNPLDFSLSREHGESFAVLL